MPVATRGCECTAERGTLYLAFELGSKTWTVGLTTAPAVPARVRSIASGDLGALTKEIATAKARFGLPSDAPVRSCYEAGRDGFWVHRWAVAAGIANVVVDSSSIEVNRRQRRAKTDRLDARRLLQLLMRWAGGERGLWSVVHVPTAGDEDERHLSRELGTVTKDRTRVRNRIYGLLATQGTTLELNARFASALVTARTGDGQPFPPGLRDRILHEWAHLVTVEARLAALVAARADRIATGTTRVATIARQLTTLRAIGGTSAALFSAELFGTRTFANPRQLGALTGLVPVPYRSDQRVADQGISKAGRAELRRVAIQIAWLWVRWQPDSALTQWFERRFNAAGGRARRIGIVALARKLVIALWRFAEQGVIPEGAELKPTT